MSGQLSVRRADLAAARAGPGALVDVIVLSADLALFEAIRGAVGERNPVWRARSAEESVDLLLTGRCGVLLVDLAAVSTRPDTLIEQIMEQFPDVVVCVAGTLEDEALLAPLISDGLVYRFIHKPITSRRASMFLQAAIRHHGERREQISPVGSVAHRVTGLSNRFEPWKWAFVTIGVALFVMILAVAFGHRAPQGAEPGAPAATPPADGAAASAAVVRADPVLSSARAAFDAGRYEAPAGRNALDLYKAVLLAHPDNAEARRGFDQTILKMLEAATQAADAQRNDEARRLVDRVLAVDPGRRSAQSLASRLRAESMPSLSAAATPSQQLAAESSRAPAQDAHAAPASTAAPAPRVRATTPLVYPDPLAPHFTNAPVAATEMPRRGRRAYGAPITTGLPTAGYVTAPVIDPSTTQPRAADAEPMHRGSVAAAATGPADALERVVAVDPVYPAEALRSHTTGWVELEFTVTESGTVRDIEVVQAQPQGVFEQAATSALGQWRFRPRVVNGQPVVHRSSVTLRFDVVG